MTIFVDMDDVLCDFHSFYASLIEPEIPAFTAEQWDTWKHEMTVYDFATLFPTHWFYELRDFLRNHGDYYIITSAELPAHIEGKYLWLQTFWPEVVATRDRRLIIAQAKHLCATPKRLLLDDYNVNTEAWREAGGDAILVPAPHQSNTSHSDISEFDPVKEIKSWLKCTA